MVVHRAGMGKVSSNGSRRVKTVTVTAKTLAEMQTKTKAKIAAKIMPQLDHRKALLANPCQKRRATKPCHKRLCLRQNLSSETQTTTQIIETPMAAMLTVAMLTTLIANIEVVAEADKYLKY